MQKQRKQKKLSSRIFFYCFTIHLSANELDEVIEDWFEKKWSATLNFDISDALSKIDKLGFATKNKTVNEKVYQWHAKPMQGCINALCHHLSFNLKTAVGSRKVL